MCLMERLTVSVGQAHFNAWQLLNLWYIHNIAMETAMAIYDPLYDEMQTAQTVEIVVRIKVREGVDIQEVINDMNYDFEHGDILSTEIVDINTEV